MSLNAMHRNVMIFAGSQNKAINKMNELVSDKEIIKRTRDCVTTNEGTYQAKGFSESCRGYRYREVYIEESLKNDPHAMDLIKMKLVPPHYYQGFEVDENYKFEDHIHYFEGE